MTDPYGQFNQSTPGGSTTPDPRLGFQGQYLDPNSGNYHLRARDYTTTSGRFTSVDPLSQTSTAPAESSYVYGHDNPLTNTDPSGMGCGIFAVVCNAVSSAATAVVHTVSTVVNTVTTAVTNVVNTAVSVVKDVVSNVATAAKTVVNKAVSTAKAVVHQASNAVHTAAHWVDQHKAAIAGIASGILVGAACEALTAGAGSIGCAALAGAVGSMVEYGVGTPGNQLSLGGFLKAGAIGAVTGALGGVAGKLLGSAVSGLAGKVFSKVLGSAEEGAGGAEGAALASTTEATGGRALAQGTETEAVDGAQGAAARACLHSFAPSTTVLMADGTQKAIKDIKVGDRVLATDPATGRAQARLVTALHLNHDTDLADIVVRTGVGATTVLHTTQSHPFWDQNRGGWVAAANLRPGDRLRTTAGQPAVVVSVETHTGVQPMRDLTVDADHTYYIVAAGTPVLVHNCGFEDFAHGTSVESGQNIVNNGLSEAAGKANIYGSKAPGSFFTVPVDQADKSAALETAAFWGARHGGETCVVVCRLPSSVVADLESRGLLQRTTTPVQAVFHPDAFPTVNQFAEWIGPLPVGR
jgi:RHS repeat-associated protein